jgi:CHAD domain-containing protein/CYTH domain-containing protein
MQKNEIERRYLLKPLKIGSFLRRHGLRAEVQVIRQYYLRGRGSAEYVRYRKSARGCFRTFKSGEGLVRLEKEEDVPCEEYSFYLARRNGHEIRKKRYNFEYDGRIYELDRFGGMLKGLWILELEFEDVEDAEHFLLPDIFDHVLVAELTGIKEFNNSSLCLMDAVPSLGSVLEDTGLSPYMPAGTAFRRQIMEMTETMKNDMRRLHESDDPETLHSFRITQRRLRVWLGELKEITRNGWNEKQRKCLGGMMRRSNLLRDLDVMIQTVREYRRRLEEGKRKYIDALESELLGRRRQCGNLLAAPEYTEEFRSCMDGFSPEVIENLDFSREADSPVILALMQKLKRRWKDIRKKTGKLDVHSPAKSYHRLRIEFKKQRYLIESSLELADSGRARHLLKKIRKILSLLGEHHDLSVQEEILLDLKSRSLSWSPEERGAYGALMRWMEKRRKKLQKKIRRSLRRFFRQSYIELDPYIVIS